MSWTQIIGYDREKKILQKAILERRVASAYCFMGMEGIGKDALAIQFAKTLNCESPIIAEDTIDSCDKCKSCKQFGDFSHPNLDYIYALPKSKKVEKKDVNPIENLTDEQIEEIKSELEKKQKNPYHKMEISDANQIKISSVRYLKKQLTLSDTGRGRRVAIISGADKMNDEAANSFLKTLEEPLNNTTIILTTSNPNRMLQTILSRCQQINFGPMKNDDVVKALIQKNNFAVDDAILAAAFGQGSYTRSLESANEDMINIRNHMVEMIRTSVKKNFRTKLIESIEELLKISDKNKLHSALQLLLLWVRDAMLLQQNGNPDLILNMDQTEVLQKFSEYYKKHDLNAIIREIENASFAIYKNVNQSLIFLRLFVKIREILMVKIN